MNQLEESRNNKMREVAKMIDEDYVSEYVIGKEEEEGLEVMLEYWESITCEQLLEEVREYVKKYY